jgi:hypothetical protein
MKKLTLTLLLTPALTVIVLLFGGGLLLALLQSLGYVPAIGRTDLSCRGVSPGV